MQGILSKIGGVQPATAGDGDTQKSGVDLADITPPVLKLNLLKNFGD